MFNFDISLLDLVFKKKTVVIKSYFLRKVKFKDRQQSIRPILVRAQYHDSCFFPARGLYMRKRCLKAYFRGYLMV